MLDPNLVGKKFRASDGGNYGVFIVALLPEVDDYVVMSIGRDGEMRYEEEPRRLSVSKIEAYYNLKSEWSNDL